MNSSTRQKDHELQGETGHHPSATEPGPPPYHQTMRHEFLRLSSSHLSAVPDLIAHPAKLFTIEALGVGGCKSHGMDRRVPVYVGTNTHAEPLYVSSRTSRWGNDCTLSHAKKGDILTTAYRWGYGSSREPKIRWIVPHSASGDGGSDDSSLAIAVKSSWLCFDNHVKLSSTTDRSLRFKWKYLRTQTRDEGSRRVLALFSESWPVSSEKRRAPLAVLVRTASTRTPKTSRFGSGNGGQLLLSSSASQLDEAVVIASCIMMLKKEIDRAKHRR